MTVRKNITGLVAQDLLLKWQYETGDGHDVYHVHAAIDYVIGARPLGTFTINPRSGSGTLEVRRELIGAHLQATGPEVNNG